MLIRIGRRNKIKVAIVTQNVNAVSSDVDPVIQDTDERSSLLA